MKELGLPFELVKPDKREFYTLRVCKDCRADWMSAIKTWFKTKPIKDETREGYYARDLGTARFITTGTKPVS